MTGCWGLEHVPAAETLCVRETMGPATGQMLLLVMLREVSKMLQEMGPATCRCAAAWNRLAIAHYPRAIKFDYSVRR